MEPEIRTRKSPLMQSMIDAVRAHAEAHYAEGWDPIVEATDDDQLVAMIGYCRSQKSAIERIAKGLDLRAEVRHDVRSAGGIDEPAPEPAARLTEAEAATLAAAAGVMDGTGTIEALNAALFPDGVAEEFAQMEAEGRIVDETGQLASKPKRVRKARTAADGTRRRGSRKAAEPNAAEQSEAFLDRLDGDLGR
jgi:hypothetical protein